MTGPKENSEFCFVSGNNEGEGKQKSLFPAGPVIKCFVIPPNKNCEGIVCFTPSGSQICHGF